jgi:hypothetical protein
LILSLTGTSFASRKQVDGLMVVADREVRLADAVRGLKLQRVVAALSRDGERAPTHLDGLTMLAQDIPEPRAHIRKYPSQASTVAEPRRQDLSLAHQIQRVTVSPERYERDSKIELRVNSLGEHIWALGKALSQ